MDGFKVRDYGWRAIDRFDVVAAWDKVSTDYWERATPLAREVMDGELAAAERSDIVLGIIDREIIQAVMALYSIADRSRGPQTDYITKADRTASGAETFIKRMLRPPKQARSIRTVSGGLPTLGKRR